MRECSPYELAMRGWPGTVRFRVPGGSGGAARGYRIVPFYHTPLAAPAADVLVNVWIWDGVLATFVMLDAGPPDRKDELALLIFAGMFVGAWPFWMAMRLLLASATVIEITPETVTVLGWLGERRYGRIVPIGFELHPHWKLRRAMLCREEPARHLREAFHLVMRYGHEAVVLATIHGEVRARTLLDRLNGCFAATGPGIENAALHGPENQYSQSDDF